MASGASKQAYIVPNQGGSKAPKITTVPDPNKSVAGTLNGPNAPSTIQSKPPALKPGNVASAVAASPPGTPAPQPTPVAGAGAAPAVSPFLTADQTAAFNTSWNNYQNSLNTDTTNLGNATVNEAASIKNDAATALQNGTTENASAAARGLFNSSIRDGALNDIAATQANNDYIAATNLSQLSDSINANIKLLNDNWGATQTLYNAYAVTNAQGVTPVVPPAAAAATPTATTVNAPGLLGAGAAEGVKAITPGAGSAGNAAGNKAVAQQKARQSIGAGLTNAGKNTGAAAGSQQTYGALS